MKKLLTLLFVTTLFSCNQSSKKVKVYKTTDNPGYCYYDNGLWYIYYLQSNGMYSFYGTQSSYNNYSSSDTYNWVPSPSNTSNYNEMPQEVISEAQSVSAMQESSGSNEGGYESENSSSGSGMQESTGTNEGGASESTGSDAGDGGDSGGGGGD